MTVTPPEIPFDIDSDLAALRSVLETGRAREAVVFYAARILEGSTGRVVEDYARRRCRNVVTNINTVAHHGLAAPWEVACFHTLRDLGNDARHIRRRLAEEDERLALELLVELLGWSKIKRREVGEALRESVHHASVEKEAFGALRRGTDHLQEMRELWQRNKDTLLRTPLIPALYAERLLEAERASEALVVIREARAHPPLQENLRLVQLESLALRWSGGDALEAIALLEALPDEDRTDFETVGLLAGAYKSVWKASHGTDSDALRIAAQLYQKGWVASKRSNGYLGVNAAACALLRGDPLMARRTAIEIREAYRGRKEPAFSNYWDHVTQAEAALLAGEVAFALQEYRAAFEKYVVECKGNFGTTRDQLSRLARALRLGADHADVIGTQKLKEAVNGQGQTHHEWQGGGVPPVPESGARRVAVLGAWRPSSDVAAAAHTALARLANLEAESGVLLITRLRSGLDRAVAHHARTRGTPYRVLLDTANIREWLAGQPDPDDALLLYRGASETQTLDELAGDRKQRPATHRLMARECDVLLVFTEGESERDMNVEGDSLEKLRKRLRKDHERPRVEVVQPGDIA